MEEDVPELIEVGTHPDSEDAVLNEEVGSDENEEDVEVDDVTMVPMADILNARQGCNNVSEKFLAFILLIIYRPSCITKKIIYGW